MRSLASSLVAGVLIRLLIAGFNAEDETDLFLSVTMATILAMFVKRAVNSVYIVLNDFFGKEPIKDKKEKEIA